MNFNWKHTLESYLRNPAEVFSILILGERGTGKTSFITKSGETMCKEVVHVNCASFSDETMALSQLFGYMKGAFTGAVEETKGYFQEANGNILFLDEIHHLSPLVQAKMMTALQTEPKGTKNQGKYKISKVGSTKSEYISFRPIFATNRDIASLREKLEPDFFDRISQLIVEIPSIREQKLDIYREFEDVWKAMDFQKENKIPAYNDFKNWLKKLELHGNYRTLQTIAINWHQARLMLKNEQKGQIEKEKDAFEFVKSQYKKYLNVGLTESKPSNYNFRKNVSKKQMEYEYQEALYNWALSDKGYGSGYGANKILIEGMKISRLNKPKKKF